MFRFDCTEFIRDGFDNRLLFKRIVIVLKKVPSTMIFRLSICRTFVVSIDLATSE